MKHKPASAAALAERFLTAGDSVLEIGAADGVHTRVYASRVGHTGHVLAVEPHRGQGQALREMFEDTPWVTVQQAAIGATVGESLFYPDVKRPKCSSVWPENVATPGDPYLVPVTTIDALVASMPRTPKLIQIDAQGAEAAILRGARKTLTLPIVWVIEVWASGLSATGASVSDVLLPFQTHAYTPRSILGKRLDWYDAEVYAAGRVGPSHADFVMVPDDLMEADW